MRNALYTLCLLASLTHRASCREPPLEEAANASSSGAAADPDLLPDGGRLPGRIHARHILVMHRNSQRAPATISRSREEALTRAQTALRRARAGEDFATLVREYSDEPDAAGRGGDLGTFGRGQMVPQFERVAFRLQIDEISEVTESPFGFHVIQRLAPQ